MNKVFFYLKCMLSMLILTSFQEAMAARYLQIMQNSEPEAHAWFCSMQQKYPQAGLKDIIFGYSVDEQDDVGWCMFFGENAGKFWIICPRSKINGSFTNSDECSLLHEAGHVRNHTCFPVLKGDGTSYKAAIATLAVGTFVAGNYFQKAQKYPYFENNSVASCALSAAVVYGLYKGFDIGARPLVGRIDEMMADSYAFKHADVGALIGRHERYIVHGDLQTIWYKNIWHHWAHDFEHPHSHDRAYNIQNALLNRFGIHHTSLQSYVL